MFDIHIKIKFDIHIKIKIWIAVKFTVINKSPPVFYNVLCFIIWNNLLMVLHLREFFDMLNNLDDNIKFTMENMLINFHF